MLPALGRQKLLFYHLVEPVSYTHLRAHETDSGLDIDGIRTVSEGVNAAIRGTDSAALIITHYSRILEHVQPDMVHVLLDGRIVASGGPELATKLEERGYEWLKEE